MAITTNTNISSLRTQRELGRADDILKSAFEKLSSGLRINKAADDAAGLAISERLRSEFQNLGQASRNASDGISLLSIAEGSVSNAGDIVARMRELATQSANGTLNDTERGALQEEYAALGTELDRISGTTTFNGQPVLGSTVTLQTNDGSDPNSQTTVAIGQVNTTSLGVAGTDISTQAGALTAITQTKAATDLVTGYQGTIGAAQSGLSVQISNLASRRESIATAESGIRDADIATEAANLAKGKIRKQAAVAVLAQANQQPGLALKLLGRG